MKMKNFRRFCGLILLVAAFTVSAFAGETQSPPCTNPGEMNSPPCAALGEVQTPGAAIVGDTQGPSAPGNTQGPTFTWAAILFGIECAI
jgi:hypothetical protein